MTKEPRSKTAESPRVTTYQELPLEDLKIERFQVRKENVGQGLEELATSIEKYGLLQPIVVCKKDKPPGKWEIVCGQRRYLAHVKILKLKKIMAGIINHPISYEEGLALSASENIVRLDMTRKDLIDLCADLFKKYESIKDVVEETKLPYPVVRKYIRYDGLPLDLKERVDNKDINIELAMKVQDAASASGKYNSKEAKDLISLLNTVDDPIRKKIIELRKKNPTVPLDKIAKKAEEPEKTLKLKLTLGVTLADPLRKYADDEDTDLNTAVEGFIESALQQGGYMGEKE